MRRRLAAIVLLLLAASARADVHSHVRVVLDLSQSMRRNDPGRLAILSTMLLHDLARPNSTRGDSFRVIPFDLDWRWQDPNAAPPASTQPRIEAAFGRRKEFVGALQNLPYEARMTYFYPGLAAALAELEQTEAATQDVRAIVLVTDGVPEAATRDAELRRIREELGPRLERESIRLYVLAFGAEADRNREFFDRMVHAPSNASLGEFFVDAQGTRLLTFMTEIFSRSFGYSPDPPRTLPGVTSVDLEASIRAERAAIAVFSGTPQPPALRLTAPAQGTLNAPEAVQSAATPGGSYSLLWVLSPSPGMYGLDSDETQGQVAVLRPARVSLEIAPAPPLKQVERALAETPFPLRVVVRPLGGVQGDPGPVDLSFRTAGERAMRDGKPGHVWSDDLRAPQSADGTPGPNGRTYDIVANFAANPRNPGEMYVGYVEMWAKRREAAIGWLEGVSAHRVEVYPRLAIAPVPLTSYASPVALERRQQACTSFSFALTAGQLPHPDKPSYPVRGFVVADRAVLDRELYEASFTLDGHSIDADGRPSPQPGVWSKGRALAPAELLGTHTFCVKIGKPKAADPRRPVDVKVAVTLGEAPYDEFDVIQPFTLRVPVAPPTFLQRWRALLIGGASMLSLFALLWYSRDRPSLPPDLGYAVARESSAAALVPCTFDERPALARLLGWVSDSAVVPPGEDRALARVRPAGEELFRLKPARGVQVETWNGGEPVALDRGLATIGVQRTYRLRAPGGTYLFRMEYR
ncbi:MAG: VWA domain-containing protein [Acidobacteriota bacterium]|nr:VWA domain-containing protein [Acidobacteriota bacterium]